MECLSSYSADRFPQFEGFLQLGVAQQTTSASKTLTMMSFTSSLMTQRPSFWQAKQR